MENDINNSEAYETIYHDELEDFSKEHWTSLLDEEIKMIEIKNIKTNIPKFTLQIYPFVYDILLNFPACTFIFETITTQDFLENVYRLISFKVNIHHSHVTGKMIGCAHNFCNMKVRENQAGFSCTAHSYLNFDFYFMLRSYRVLCWGEDINIGRSNLSNIKQQMKIIDTMKYFQASLAQIGSTVASEEKNRSKKLMLRSLIRHDYVGKIWSALTHNVKEKIIDVLSDGKGMIPYEKIIGVNSLDIVPKKDFFDASGFDSYLKDKCITQSNYETAKYLWINLKMRNLNDMNDL